MMKKAIPIQDVNQLILLGLHDSNIKIIEKNFNANFFVRNGEIMVSGEPEELTLIENVFAELIYLTNRNSSLSELEVKTTIDIIKGNEKLAALPRKNDDAEIVLYTKRGFIKPKTAGQQLYYQAAKKNDILFAIGPAGTGKTYLSVAIALSYLRDKQVEKIILARPAVEAGESLGFLPGDLKEKIDPYLRPLYDALFDMVATDKLKKYIETSVIEIVPLAYMRGRTLNNAFVILDEAQNATAGQMKMFLTRLGINSRAIITGDITQIDLPNKIDSGLVQIQQILKGIEGVDFIYLSNYDVVRHKLVRDIIQAYENYSETNNNQKKK
ncbi:PhoH family protein [candidate division KSB1 bacterium]|nr:PhoH family protein [candidate division KSB1 bacterium]